ncbi:hypothetical protein A4X13_0g5619 [Tilletia indica]|uniref:Transcription factor Iwr1 domain-containing protein n=1 Tax=Tilletia indica TaxID=43049 RepID=A0A177TAD5_9BASI|nr:hypothetical protein A4X13_0g5619 [Tilletia indica]
MANRSTGPNGRQKRRAPKRPATNSLSVTHPEIFSLALPPSLTPRMGSFEAVEVPDTGLLAASRRSTRAFRSAAREAVEATREAHLTLRIIETLLDLPAVAPTLTQELTDRYRAWQELHPHRPPPQPTSLLPLPPSGPTPSTSGPGNGPSSSRISQGRPISGDATATATATARRGTSLADVIEIVDSDSDDTARRLRPPPPPPKKTKLSKQKGKGKARQTSDDEGDSEEEEEEVISAQAAAAAIPAVPLSFPPNDDGLDDRGGDNVVVDDDDRSASDLWGGKSSGEDKGADGSDTDLWGGESGDDVDMGDGYLWGVKSETGGEILLFLGNDNDNDNDNSNGGGGGGGDGNGDVDGDVDGRTVFQTGPMVVFDPAMEGESEETFRLQYPNCSPEPCSDESEDECECYQDTEPEPDSDSDLHDANTWQGYEMPTQDTGTAREEGDEEIQ